jgi:hypothetical protein
VNEMPALAIVALGLAFERLDDGDALGLADVVVGFQEPVEVAGPLACQDCPTM